MAEKKKQVEPEVAPAVVPETLEECDMRLFDLDPNEMTCVINGNKVVHMGSGVTRVTVECRGEQP